MKGTDGINTELFILKSSWCFYLKQFQLVIIIIFKFYQLLDL